MLQNLTKNVRFFFFTPLEDVLSSSYVPRHLPFPTADLILGYDRHTVAHVATRGRGCLWVLVRWRRPFRDREAIASFWSPAVRRRFAMSLRHVRRWLLAVCFALSLTPPLVSAAEVPTDHASPMFLTDKQPKENSNRHVCQCR